MSLLTAQFLCKKCLKSDIVFLRYGNFIYDIIADQWKVDFEEVWESGQSIGVW